jgi:hypothetical protein
MNIFQPNDVSPYTGKCEVGWWKLEQKLKEKSTIWDVMQCGMVEVQSFRRMAVGCCTTQWYMPGVAVLCSHRQNWFNRMKDSFRSGYSWLQCGYSFMNHIQNSSVLSSCIKLLRPVPMNLKMSFKERCQHQSFINRNRIKSVSRSTFFDRNVLAAKQLRNLFISTWKV